MLLIYLSLAFLAGIFLGSLFNMPLPYLALGVIPLIPIAVSRKRWKTLLAFSVCLTALLGGAVRYPASQPVINQGHLAFYNDGGAVTVTGMVVNDPEAGNRITTFHLAADSIVTDGVTGAVSGTVLVRSPATADYRYGDRLLLSGKLESPKAFEGFDYPAYLARQDIYSVMSYPGVRILEREQGWPPLQRLHNFRQALARSLVMVLPEPQASISIGILLGMRSGIPGDFNDALSETGTAHILAISGFNITIVLGIMLGVIVRLIGRQRYIYVWLTMAGMWLYVMLAGMQAPVVRAAVMGSMFLLAELSGRQKSATNALLFAAAVMAGIHPQVLWQAGFQMSFMAMLGLTMLAQPWQARAREQVDKAFNEGTALNKGFTFMTDSLAVTAAATITVYPVIAYYFGIVSLVGMPATFFGAVALPGIIVTSALTAVLGLIVWPPGWIAGWAAWLFTSYLMLVVRAFHALPLASVTVEFSGWSALGTYMSLAVLYAGIRYRCRIAGWFRRLPQAVRATTGASSVIRPGPLLRWLVITLLVISCLVWTAALSLPDDELHVSILDVGQGDSILIQTPDRQKVLIDGGPGIQGAVTRIGERLPFWDRSIDLIILTQPQADHLTGLLSVLERYNVGKIIEPGITYSSAGYRRWQDATAKTASRSTARAGRHIELGRGIRLEILHPGERLLNGTGDDINNNAMVVRLTWDKVSFLLTSDIATEGELELLTRRTEVRSTVLKVAHHGSRTSSSARFLDAVNPEVAVISAGRDNSFGHPHPEVVSRLVKQIGENRLYVTAAHGTVEFTTNGQMLWVKTERQPS